MDRPKSASARVMARAATFPIGPIVITCLLYTSDMPIRVFNGGIGGDTAYDMNKRLDGDIFAMKPSVLMVTFGMNDSGYFEYNGDKPKRCV